jgi:hypothetical protein
MASEVFVPHIEILLHALRISRERLASRSKVAIDTRVLRALLETLATQMPFDPEFYLEANPDVAKAHAAGQISDLHQHFAETGFFEGRFGAAPTVDEGFYTALYGDIDPAVRRGDLASATEHYIRAGAAEGRVPNAAIKSAIDRWAAILAD